MKCCRLLPHNPLWESLLFGISSYIHDRYWMTKFKHMIFRDGSSWTCTSFLIFFIMVMSAHSIFVFKTYLPAKLLFDQSLDHSSNILINTWSSSFSYSFNFDSNIWFKHFCYVQNRQTKLSANISLYGLSLANYQNHIWGLHALSKWLGFKVRMLNALK
jgi:hypothetical protein